MSEVINQIDGGTTRVIAHVFPTDAVGGDDGDYCGLIDVSLDENKNLLVLSFSDWNSSVAFSQRDILVLLGVVQLGLEELRTLFPDNNDEVDEEEK